MTFADEYQALRDGRGMVRLQEWSSISITGAHRQKFLNNFCTNDVMRLAPGDCCEAFFLNVKGKIIGHGLLGSRGDEVVFMGAPGQSPRLIELLDRYIIREDVQLRDTTSERSWMLDFKTAGQAANSFSWNLIGSPATRVVDAEMQEASASLEVLVEGGMIEVGDAAFNAARIEAGMPLFGVDFDDNNLPQEVGRDKEAISFTKGCYLGQETVARIDALGHVNQRIATVKFSGSELPPVGLELMREAAVVGRVTSAAFSPALNAPIALAMIRREANAIGTLLTSTVGECEVVATGMSR